MTREIKFRGMDVNGKLHVGNLTISHKGRTDGIKAGSYISSKDGTMPWAYEVRPETVGQFTGLHDISGVEIYEGDIVNVPYNRIGNIEVTYGGNSNPCGFNIGRYNLDVLTVVGNIHTDMEE